MVAFFLVTNVFTVPLLLILYHYETMIFHVITTDYLILDLGIILLIGLALFVSGPSFIFVLGVFAIYGNATPIWLRCLRFAEIVD